LPGIFIRPAPFLPFLNENEKMQKRVDFFLQRMYIYISSSAMCRRSNGAALSGVTSFFKFFKFFIQLLFPVLFNDGGNILVPDKVSP